MFLEVLLATIAIAALSLVGIFFFGSDKRLVGIEKYVVPLAVGVFLALVLNELIPETLQVAPVLGPSVIAFSFVGVYVLAHIIHTQLHRHGVKHNEKREAALLILIGDALHNFADGVLIAGGFLVSVEVGIAVTLAMALHELPQEIVEFGVLVRAGYTRTQALKRNAFSASTVIVGGLMTIWFVELFAGWIWLLTAFVAGNLLYVAASELLPRLHRSHSSYGSFAAVVIALLLGYGLTSGAIVWAHEQMLPEGVHDHSAVEESVHDHDDHDEHNVNDDHDDHYHDDHDDDDYDLH